MFCFFYECILSVVPITPRRLSCHSLKVMQNVYSPPSMRMTDLPIMMPLILILNVWCLVGVVYLVELILKKFEAMKILHMPFATSRHLCELICDW